MWLISNINIRIKIRTLRLKLTSIFKFRSWFWDFKQNIIIRTVGDWVNLWPSRYKSDVTIPCMRSYRVTAFLEWINTNMILTNFEISIISLNPYWFSVWSASAIPLTLISRWSWLSRYKNISISAVGCNSNKNISFFSYLIVIIIPFSCFQRASFSYSAFQSSFLNGITNCNRKVWSIIRINSDKEITVNAKIFVLMTD